MSEWVYIDCIFRTYSSGSSSYDDSKRYIKYGRNKQLKNIYKALSKIKRIERENGHPPNSLKFTITPIFNMKYTKYGGYSHDDEIVINIFGNLRCDTNSDNRYTNLIKDIWYKSNLDIFSGVCSITDNYYGVETFTYDSWKSEFLVFKNDIMYLDNIQYHVDKFKINEDKGWFKINSKKYIIDEVIENAKHYTKLFQSMGIPIRIFNKNV